VSAFYQFFLTAMIIAISVMPVPLLMAQGTVSRFPTPVTRDTEPAVSQKKPLNFEVLIQTQPSYRVKSQEWGKVLQEVGYSPQFRLAKPGEQVRVEDVEVNGKITVHIVSGMGPDGSLRVGSRKFTIAEIKSLRELLDDLAMYGAGGPPAKNPKWGLTEEQLLEVTQLLAEPVSTEVSLESPVVTIESLGLPSGFRMSFTDAAREKALSRRPDTAPESLDLKGFSKGTAIAVLLAQYGLGFRPQRISAGRYQIEIDGGNESSNLWPVGWKTQESLVVVLPAWLKSIPVDVEDAEVSELLQIVADRLEIPMQTSSLSLAAAGRNLDELTYSRKADRVSPARLLTAIGDKLELGFDVRVDEGGKMFLWATTRDESTAFRTRFAHVKQK